MLSYNGCARTLTPCLRSVHQRSALLSQPIDWASGHEISSLPRRCPRRSGSAAVAVILSALSLVCTAHTIAAASRRNAILILISFDGWRMV